MAEVRLAIPKLAVGIVSIVNLARSMSMIKLPGWVEGGPILNIAGTISWAGVLG